MPKAARLTDMTIGICCCHGGCIPMMGVIVTSSSNTITDNLLQARVTDLVLGLCGHIGLIVTGSGDVITNNLRTARVGDLTAGCLITTIVTGSPDTIVDG